MKKVMPLLIASAMLAGIDHGAFRHQLPRYMSPRDKEIAEKVSRERKAAAEAKRVRKAAKKHPTQATQ